MNPSRALGPLFLFTWHPRNPVRHRGQDRVCSLFPFFFTFFPSSPTGAQYVRLRGWSGHRDGRENTHFVLPPDFPTPDACFGAEVPRDQSRLKALSFFNFFFLQRTFTGNKFFTHSRVRKVYFHLHPSEVSMIAAEGSWEATRCSSLTHPPPPEQPFSRFFLACFRLSRRPP